MTLSLSLALSLSRSLARYIYMCVLYDSIVAVECNCDTKRLVFTRVYSDLLYEMDPLLKS